MLMLINANSLMLPFSPPPSPISYLDFPISFVGPLITRRRSIESIDGSHQSQ